MSLNILFISDTILIERTTVHGNIDPKLLYPEIKTAQDMYIQPLLGSALFKIADRYSGRNGKRVLFDLAK